MINRKNAYMFFVATLFFLSLLVLSCAKRDDDIDRINAFDSDGVNYFPPTVVAMGDTSLSINDTLLLTVDGADSNGTVEQFFWRFSPTDTVRTTELSYKHCFLTAKVDTVLVWAVDNDGLFSAQPDTIIVTVTAQKPTVSIEPKTTTIALNEEVTVSASASDSDGVIAGFQWAVDSTHFRPVSALQSHTLKFNTPGLKLIRVKALDEDSLVSPVDTCKLLVKDKAPIVYSPLNKEVIEGKTAALKWYKGIYTNSFKVVWDTVSPPVANSKVTVDTTLTLSTLDYTKDYYWYVMGYNNEGDSAQSEVWKFTTGDKIDIPSGDLLAYYPFNSNANDASGNGNDGMPFGSPVLTSDRFGTANSAYSFDGVDDYIRLESIGSSDMQFTLSSWFLPQETPDDGVYQEVVTLDKIISTAVYTTDGVSKLHVNIGDGTNWLQPWISTKTVELNRWYNLTITGDMQSGLVVYVDGSEVGTIPIALTTMTPAAKFTTGAKLSTSGTVTNYNKATIDDIRIYNKALSVEEVEAIFYENNWMPQLSMPVLSASAKDNNTVSLSWNSVLDALSYEVEVSSDGLTFSPLYSGSQTNYDHTGLTKGQKFWYRVKAVGDGKASIWSAVKFAILNDGLVAAYSFSGNANDESGNENHGTVNGATLTADRFGNANSAYAFDGVNDYIDLGMNVSLDTTFTYSLWCKSTNLSKSDQRLISNTEKCGAQLAVNHTGYDGTLLAQVHVNESYKRLEFNYSSDIEDRWIFVQLVKELDSIKIYVDGENVCAIEASGAVTLSTVHMLIGAEADPDSPTSFFEGAIDDIQIYSRAITVQEIEDLYYADGYVPSLTQPITAVKNGENNTNTVTWNKVTDATSYTIEQSSDGLTFSTLAASVTDTLYAHSNLTTGQKVWYRVKAYGQTPKGDIRESDWSEVVWAVNTNGLVASYSFSGNAQDESGNGHHGTVNGATLIADRFGNANSAYSFDGNDDYIQIEHHEDLDLMTDPKDSVTIIAWFKSDTVNDYAILSKCRPTGWGDMPYTVNLNEDGVARYWRYDDNPQSSLQTLGKRNLADNNWHQIVFVNAGEACHKIYVDGSLETENTDKWSSLLTNSYPLVLGAYFNYTASTDYFRGTIDDVQIYNRSLSTEEINTLFHQGDWFPQLPAPDIKAMATDTSVIEVTWNAIYDAMSYNVEYSSDGVNFSELSTTTSLSYSHTGLVNSQKLWYRVKAIGSHSNDSEWSDLRWANTSWGSNTLGTPVDTIVFENGWSKQITVSETRMLVDDGGVDENYSHDFTGVITFSPADPNMKVIVDMQKFKTYDDYFSVYNGGTISNQRIGYLRGIADPTTLTSTSADGKLTIKFSSDGSLNNIGWEAIIAQVPAVDSVTQNLYKYAENLTTDLILQNKTSDAYKLSGSVGFYDDGGIDGNYLDNFDAIYTIFPETVGKTIEIEFEKFKTYDDYLSVYDGTTTGATRIAYYSGNPSTEILRASNPNGALTIKFSSDNSLNDMGWEAVIREVD